MSVAMDEWPRRHRITVEEYYRMAEVGLLAPDARVELIEGEIIDIHGSADARRAASCTDRVAARRDSRSVRAAPIAASERQCLSNTMR